MADFEDATSPTWANLIEGQANLTDAIERTIELTTPEGKEYRLGDETATLLVRPRGWHLPERHFLVDGEPVSGGDDFADVAEEVVAMLLAEPRDVLTLLAGEGHPALDGLVGTLEAQNPELEIELHEGGQPLYPLLISAE
jgi:hypothetical protein